MYSIKLVELGYYILTLAVCGLRVELVIDGSAFDFNIAHKPKYDY